MTKKSPTITTQPATVDKVLNPLRSFIEAFAFDKARLVLFPNRVNDPAPDVEYPVMTGSIECTAFKVGIAGFEAIAEDTGRRYLSISVGDSGQIKSYGKLFKEEKPGKENQYFGFIELSQKDAITGEYETLWKVGIDAKRDKSAEGKQYISGSVFRLNMKGKEPVVFEESAFPF
jgi:uncharacterized protein (DUF736 family)